jgi:thiamine-monophosphate kinase
VLAAAVKAHTQVTCIGRITTTPGITLLDAQGQPLPAHYAAFDHFHSP